MDYRLCEAAITGDVFLLHEIIGKDPLILDKFVVGFFESKSPLHVATSSRQKQFVKALLRLKPKLAEVLDSQQRSALHLAAAEGYYDISGKLTDISPQMCLVRDRDGNNPIHIAAMKGNISVLVDLFETSPNAARVRLDGNETILHMCVKHNQLESLMHLLEKILDQGFLNAKDNDGNTILHLAILNRQFEIAEYLLSTWKMDVDAINSNGHTAMDVLFLLKDRSCFVIIEDLLQRANARRGKDLLAGEWLTNKTDSLMVVASLIATMAFQAGVNPPGGVWQGNSNGHIAGEAVMAYNYADSYPYFLRFNTIGFVASLSVILLLISGLKFRNKATMWMLVVIMWLAITSMAITYAFSIVVVTPKKDRKSLSSTFVIAVIVWCSVMAILLRTTFCLVKDFKHFVKDSEERRNRSIKRTLKHLEDRVTHGERKTGWRQIFYYYYWT